MSLATVICDCGYIFNLEVGDCFTCPCGSQFRHRETAIEKIKFVRRPDGRFNPVFSSLPVTSLTGRVAREREREERVSKILKSPNPKKKKKHKKKTETYEMAPWARKRN